MSDNLVLDLVKEHYAIQDLPGRIENALLQAGFGSGQIDWSKLALLDQFHVRGLPATKELAVGLNLARGENVLDVGSGLGGPARYLAAVHGCHVTGIELTQPFVEVADLLSKRTGLSHRLRFVQGDALDLPFTPESFDHAWTQHVAMNISDKERLYSGICRVLSLNLASVIGLDVRQMTGNLVQNIKEGRNIPTAGEGGLRG